jgi:hypothetical protein
MSNLTMLILSCKNIIQFSFGHILYTVRGKQREKRKWERNIENEIDRERQKGESQRGMRQTGEVPRRQTKGVR